MVAPFIRLAASKANSTVERGMLAQVLTLAVRLDEIEASFESNINASKAARGESPTKLSKAKRASLRHFEEDAKEMEGQQLVALEAMTHSADVIAALHTGMESDVKFWKQAQRHTPSGCTSCSGTGRREDQAIRIYGLVPCELPPE